MNVAQILAGALALVAAAIHGGVGERVVVQRLTLSGLPSSPFGGPGTTKMMIRATWHMTTIAFLTVGAALLLAGSVLEDDVARGAGLIGALGATGFAAIVVGGVIAQPRLLFRHPAPIALSAVAVLAWLGLA